MKRTLALILALLLTLGTCAAYAQEENSMEETEELSVTEISLYYRPDSEEPTHLTVGNTTKVSGSFFTTQFGNNTSDIDVRNMLHGYNPIVWYTQLEFIEDPTVVTDLSVTTSGVNTVYTITLANDLYYNDGETRVTAKDYVFSHLLLASNEIAGIGADTGAYKHIVGYEDYASGASDTFSGVRLLGDYRYSITVKGEYLPYFYELSYLSINPYPISVIAPETEVRDDGRGAYIANIDDTIEEPIFTTELLSNTIMDSENGYLANPLLACGPYKLTGYDKEMGKVDFAINEFYKGNFEGVKPVIDTVTLVHAKPETMIQELRDGNIDLLNKCVDAKVISEGTLAVAEDGDLSVLNYMRLGYGFCAFSCEQGPQQFKHVRQAIAYLFDTDTFMNEFIGGYGLPAYGYYGMGQWMYQAAEGALRPVTMTEEEELKWDEIGLEKLNHYDFDIGAAQRLITEDGWTLNQDGEPFDAQVDTLRYKRVEGELMPLSIDFAKQVENEAAQLVVDLLKENFALVGGELVVHDVTFNDMLTDYYREDGTRQYDMNFMATNFVSTFDPSMVFADGDDFRGAINTSGMIDAELNASAKEMHDTKPMALLEYLERWVAFQERFNELLPTMPIYSNVYFDFYSDWLHNYYANAEINWPVAVLYAYVEDPGISTAAIEDETDELQLGGEDAGDAGDAGDTGDSGGGIFLD